MLLGKKRAVLRRPDRFESKGGEWAEASVDGEGSFYILTSELDMKLGNEIDDFLDWIIIAREWLEEEKEEWTKTKTLS